MLTIDIQTARRFILGKQGLWPGRRWQGTDGVTQAMTAIEYLQLDPLQIIARSQDIALHSRVLDYKPGDWETAAYQQRGFFDWGGWLATRPMAELPYWRPVMQRERDGGPDCDPRIHKSGQEHAEAIAEMRAILQEQGTVSNRDFAAASRKRTDNYRGRKDSALALYYLWRTGEVMTHHRENFERVYALTEAVAPGHLLGSSSEVESDRFLILKDISFAGLARLKRTADGYNRGLPYRHSRQILADLLADGDIVEVKVDGWKPIQCALGSDLELLQTISAGHVPATWQPLDSDTTQEVSFLAPLDPVSARGRAKQLFGFDYVWEVYKPVNKRQYGYYTLPVLWGDQLVARFDSKLDRATNTFIILG
ncbi:MAG: YcaQ family DNA glycosylase, partial [Anaerolineales bacterium]|nr:YcaQ family DNA glycosylase [Anaerolineales bacterium]